MIIAEGALSETFVDDDSRGMFHNVHEYDKLYLDAVKAPARYCAPRLDHGYEVEAARQRIALRAGLASPESMGELRGSIDVVSARCVAGWAQDSEYPEAAVCLDIVAGGRLLGQVLANIYREDLAQAGLGSGRHGFAFTLPEALAAIPDSIEVRRSLDGRPLEIAYARRTKQRQRG